MIQDASREVGGSAIRWVLHSTSLMPGDELILLGILHQVNNPSTLSFMGAGFKCKNYAYYLFTCKPNYVDHIVG